MTKRINFLCVLLLCSIYGLFAQVPQAIQYQAVVRDAEGNAIIDQTVSMKICILAGAIDGNPVYCEVFQPQTNEFGLVNLQIGRGEATTGTFSDIQWGTGSYYLQLWLDIENTGDYNFMGSTQLLSVPYSLNAGSLTMTAPDGTPFHLRIDNCGNLTTDFATEQTVTDADGNEYPVVKIGNQVWMAENLNVGTMIHTVTGGDNGDGIPTNNGVIEKYCFDNNPAYCDSLGGLYHWSEAMQYDSISGAQGVCPNGWHIPTHNEWIELISYLDGNDDILDGNPIAAIAIKPSGSNGFNALFSGEFCGRFYWNKPWSEDSKAAYYWTSDYYFEEENLFIYSWETPSWKDGIWRSAYNNRFNKYAFSIRCIKNN